MSNRFLGVLIIIGFIGLGYLYYTQKYIITKELKIQEQLVNSNELIEETKEPELVKQDNIEISLTTSQKIDEIKENKGNYRTIKIDNYRKVYFKEVDNSLNLYLNDKKIGNFDIVYPEFLRVNLIEGTDNDLYIEIGDDKFIYNNTRNIIFKIDLNINVEYVKIGDNNRLIFITEKGSFIYYINTNKLEYFSYFKDFIYFSEGYIGLVKTEDIRIMKNLGFNSDKNLIIYYNPFTKEKKIVYETNLEIKKIYILNNKIYIKVNDNELFELENI